MGLAPLAVPPVSRLNPVRSLRQLFGRLRQRLYVWCTTPNQQGWL
jgi:hypothetical protein